MRLSRYLEMLFLGEYTLTVRTLKCRDRRRNARSICHHVYHIAECNLAGRSESGDCGLHSPRPYCMSHNLGTTSREEERIGGTLWRRTHILAVGKTAGMNRRYFAEYIAIVMELISPLPPVVSTNILAYAEFRNLRPNSPLTREHLLAVCNVWSAGILTFPQ